MGEIQRVFSAEGWWHADFTLDPAKTFSCVAADNLRVGSPVSVGYGTLRHDESLAKVGVMWHTVAIVDELSILRHGERPAYPGAQITFILPHKRIPRTAKTRPAPPPVKATPAQAHEPACEVFYGSGPYEGTSVITRRDHKAEAETAELNRRLEWAERHLGRVDFEQILTNLKIELGYESDLLRGVRRVAA